MTDPDDRPVRYGPTRYVPSGRRPAPPAPDRWWLPWLIGGVVGLAAVIATALNT